jgi:hypothetical protein
MAALLVYYSGHQKAAPRRQDAAVHRQVTI